MLDEEGTLQREHVAPAVSAAKERHVLRYPTEGDETLGRRSQVNISSLVICTELELADFAQLVSQDKVSNECPHMP
jgi:hypothetical protein